jgi:23S rRNA (adenine2503-C2)-methyltransferase
MGLAARRMTVSTCGIIPGIAALGGLGLQVNLSISLHAADDGLRGRLMPANRKYPLADLVKALQSYLDAGGRMITFEYALFRGVNDRAADADKLARLARRLKAKVNLIPFSPVAGLPFAAPDAGACRRFLGRLKAAGVAATLRQSKGGEIQAACGQLAGRRL